MTCRKHLLPLILLVSITGTQAMLGQKGRNPSKRPPKEDAKILVKEKEPRSRGKEREKEKSNKKKKPGSFTPF